MLRVGGNVDLSSNKCQKSLDQIPPSQLQKETLVNFCVVTNNYSLGIYTRTKYPD